jgi:formylmethanofuran dehydrogenase subunit B
MTTDAPRDSGWTCPFCPLACDHLGVDVQAQALVLSGGSCARAEGALAGFTAVPDAPAAEVDGVACDLETAVSAAAARLAASRLPLLAGLGTDVAGARALYPLSAALGAITDSAGGDALMQWQRALQDRGQFTTTLAEVRTRADVVVFVGGVPLDLAPLIAERCGLNEPQFGARHVVVLGAMPRDAPWPADGAALPGVSIEALPLHGDLFRTLSLLAALLAQRPVSETAPALHALAQRLRAARYAVLVGAPQRLPAHGALLIEAVHRIVGELNRSTRAAALWIGGGDGAATANQVFTWLSGLPLRSRSGVHGLEHEPQLFGAQRLLADGAVDALLWVSSFDAAARPPQTDLPLVALAHPAAAPACRRRASVFIAVATPGIGSGGHLFRTDGTVLMPLAAARPDALPTVADAAQRIRHALSQRRAA